MKSTNLKSVLDKALFSTESSNLFRLYNNKTYRTSPLSWGCLIYRFHPSDVHDDFLHKYTRMRVETEMFRVYWTEYESKSGYGSKLMVNTFLLIDKLSINLVQSQVSVGDRLDIINTFLRKLYELKKRKIYVLDSQSQKKLHRDIPDVTLHKTLPRKLRLQAKPLIGLAGKGYLVYKGEQQ